MLCYMLCAHTGAMRCYATAVLLCYATPATVNSSMPPYSHCGSPSEEEELAAARCTSVHATGLSYKLTFMHAPNKDARTERSDVPQCSRQVTGSRHVTDPSATRMGYAARKTFIARESPSIAWHSIA